MVGDVKDYGIYAGRGERNPIRFGSYNIRNGQNGGLELALQGVYQSNLKLVVFQEANIMDGIYTRRLASYSIVATDALIQHHV